MNSAFTIGRLCDSEIGREKFLNLKKDISKLIQSLASMVNEKNDYGCIKNACFALSCLAANENAHLHIINHSSFDSLSNYLCNLLVNVDDAETQWFAAM